jgi:hypothetical protein
MRRFFVILVVALLTGCGGGGEKEAVRQAPPRPKGDFGPVKPGSGERARPVAPPSRKPAAAIAAALDAGTVGVVGVDGTIGVRPATLDVSSDGKLERLRWSGWGSSAATGTGKLRVLDCDPTCAGGGVKVLDAKVELSEPRLCGRATYFDRAVVSAGGESPPASYVRAPC